MPPKVPRVPGEKNPSPTLGEYKANVKRILRQVVGSLVPQERCGNLAFTKLGAPIFLDLLRGNDSCVRLWSGGGVAYFAFDSKRPTASGHFHARIRADHVRASRRHRRLVADPIHSQRHRATIPGRTDHDGRWGYSGTRLPAHCDSCAVFAHLGLFHTAAFPDAGAHSRDAVWPCYFWPPRARCLRPPQHHASGVFHWSAAIEKMELSTSHRLPPILVCKRDCYPLGSQKLDGHERYCRQDAIPRLSGRRFSSSHNQIDVVFHLSSASKCLSTGPQTSPRWRFDGASPCS
jgi:hypothetical protein